jgi:adenosylhomocysteine nucleosidase
MGFGWFLQEWLRGMAGRTVRETVAAAAQQQIAGARQAAEDAAQPPRTIDVGIIFALGSESGGLEDLLENVVAIRGEGFTVRRGDWHGRHVALAVSGAGCQAAARAADALILGHRPRLAISAGFCGGLSPEVRRHDVVVADSLTDAAGNVIQLDRSRWAPVLPPAPPEVRVGRVLTAGRIVGRPAEKRALGERHQALAVDLESFAVAQVCRRHGVPLLVIRIATDALEDQLPREVERLTRQRTRAGRWGAALGAVLCRPGVVKDFYKLKENALVASDRLAGFLTRVIEMTTDQGSRTKGQ